MKFKIALFFLVLNLSVLSQERINTVFIDSINTENKTIYETTKQTTYHSLNNVFYKKTSQKEFDYTNLSLGNLYSVDLHNPLQIVLFYKDFNTIVLLDNQLNETHRIDGNKQESIINFEHIGLASRNQIWFYDFMTQKIGLYDYNSNTHKFISTPLTNKIIHHETDYNYFYWIDEENILYSSSVYGKIKTVAKIPKFDSIQIISEDSYMYLKENTLCFFNIRTNTLKQIVISEKEIDTFYYKNGIISIFIEKKVINYFLTIN